VTRGMLLRPDSSKEVRPGQRHKVDGLAKPIAIVRIVLRLGAMRLFLKPALSRGIGSRQMRGEQLQ